MLASRINLFSGEIISISESKNIFTDVIKMSSHAHIWDFQLPKVDFIAYQKYNIKCQNSFVYLFITIDAFLKSVHFVVEITH